MSADSPVFMHRRDDSAMELACQQARQTFPQFWHQVALDFNRIIPALELAALKVPFSDDPDDPESPVEIMWLDGIYFDGIAASGELLNAPNWLTSVQEGDRLEFPPAQLHDWLCVLEGEVYGAFTIQVMRAQMSERDRAEHDRAWDLPFPEPETTRVPPRNTEFEGVIAGLLAEQIARDPDVVQQDFGAGRTLLHLEALYGRAPSVRVLLAHGAAAERPCDRGWRPVQYAQSLGWSEIIALLQAASDT